MRSLIKFKIVVWLLCMGCLFPLHATTVENKYELESAMVLYKISGGGVLTNETNITVKGKGKLRFREWGAVELLEEKVQELASGSIHNIKTTEKLIKTDNKQQFDVDFEHKKILEQQIVTNKKSTFLQGLTQKGHETILGHSCELWEGKGVRKCIYKGIPLLVEYNMLGIQYQKKATSLMLDINDSLEQCTLPSFPVQKFALLKANIQTKSKKLPKEFSKRFMEIYAQMHKTLLDQNSSEQELTLTQKKVFLEHLGQNIFEKQKVFLPEFLLSMKKARVCLEQADNWIKANVCVEDVVQLKAQLTKDRTNNIEQWKGEEKEKVLNDFDNNIALLESRMTCIRSAKNITDLSTCMK